MGQLLRLEVENFKSYKGFQTIGPFSSFTAVIGPNGSGKSNLMDAISFVLGVRSTHLRSTNLKDLVYNSPSNENTKLSNRAFVAAVLKTKDGETTFKRSITTSGTSEYRINSKAVTQQEYNTELEKLNIITKAKNFLVFQGDVEAIASQSPKDLTNLIETMSGSIEYRNEYEQLKKEEQLAAEQSSISFNKKRAIAAELKSVFQQKKELDAYEDKKAKLSKLSTEHMLWKLLQLDRKIDKDNAEISIHNSQIEERLSETKNAEKQVNTSRKSQAIAFKELSKADKNIKLLEKDLEENQPTLVGLKEKLETSTKKTLSFQQSIKKLQDDYTRQKTVVDNMKSEYQTHKNAKRRTQDSWETSFTSKTLSLDQNPEALAEYYKIKAITDTQNYDRTQPLKEIGQKISQLETKIQRNEKQKEELLKQIHEKLEQERKNKEQVETESKYLSECLDEKEKIEEKIKSSNSTLNKISAKEFDINDRLKITLKEISTAKFIENESKKEKRSIEMLSALKRLFQTVYGRVSDLCKPTQRRYELAAMVTLGKFADAIVVDTNQTAINCIRYLREQRAGKATFLPLDSLFVNPVNESLRRAHPNARLVTDVLEFNTIYDKAISFVCGSNMVCDSVDVAKELCYQRKLPIKAITLDGTVIHRTGNITGGSFANVGGTSSSLSKWEKSGLEALIKTRDDLSTSLMELVKEKNSLIPVESLQVQLSDCETRCLTAKETLSRTQRWLETYSLELKNLESQYSSVCLDLGSFNQELSTLEKNRDTLSAEIRTSSQPAFIEFCTKYNYSSIDELESFIESKKKYSSKILSHDNVISKIENQLLFEEEQLSYISSELDRTKNALTELEADIIATQQEIDLIETEAGSLIQKISISRNDYQEKLVIYRNESAELEKTRSVYVEKLSSLDLISKMKSAKESELGKSLDLKLAILRKCRLEGIDIPLKGGSLSQIQISLANVSASETSGGQLVDTSSIDINPDYSVLPQSTRKVFNTDAEGISNTEELEKMYSSQISLLQNEINSMSPSTHAREKLEVLQNKLNDSDAEFSTFRNTAKKVASRFALVRSRRLELFNGMYQHISLAVDKFYKILTKSSLFPIGGTAYLNLENTYEPYLEGVKYHAMPPLKRFRDMDLLSGGEKTVAALALLFALQSYVPSPFFVLDEVDAALDLSNVVQLANYLRVRSTQLMANGLSSNEEVGSTSLSEESMANSGETTVSDTFQFIIISLKQPLYERASSLVGIYRDQGTNSSSTLTLDLSKHLV
ncbi:hypothetical protein BB558_005309 [Smittium angustum]|uniref:Structural maintenance of chromosomes protein n=1 Tax=Smittium angustum TaxID=133377 RepID=A0A2U1J0V3_SMIAN|nr:hypothetical protein BB558_005309 [Smittium angustum]